MHRLNERGLTASAALIYKELLTMETFNGVSGVNVTLDPLSGDRITGLEMQNLQIHHQDLRRRRKVPLNTADAHHQDLRSRRRVPLNTADARFAKVGEFDPRLNPSVGIQFHQVNKLIFPGGTQTAPDDGTPPAEPAGSSVAQEEAWQLPVVVAMVSLVVILLLLALLYRYQAKHHKDRAHNFRVDLERLVDAGELDPDGVSKCMPREIKRSAVTLISKLGHGAFGEVHKAVNLKSYIPPPFSKMAQNLDLRCVFVPAPWVLG